MKKFCTVNSGDYRHRVTVFSKNESTVNAMNEVAVTDATHAKRRARIISKGGREFEAASQTQADLSMMLAVRSDAKTRAIKPKMTVKLGTRTLEILAAYDRDEMREEVVLECKESVS